MTSLADEHAQVLPLSRVQDIARWIRDLELQHPEAVVKATTIDVTLDLALGPNRVRLTRTYTGRGVPR